jgi:hypothetical protein
MCTDTITEKIFLHVFPENLSNFDLVYLYQTACTLAVKALERDVESRISKAFQDPFRSERDSCGRILIVIRQLEIICL